MKLSKAWKPRTIHVLNWLVMGKSSNLVFHMETKCDKARMEFVRRKLIFENSFVVESMGESRGLATLWNHDVNIQIQSYTR